VNSKVPCAYELKAAECRPQVADGIGGTLSMGCQVIMQKA